MSQDEKLVSSYRYSKAHMYHLAAHIYIISRKISRANSVIKIALQIKVLANIEIKKQRKMTKMNVGAVLSKFGYTICSDNRRNPQHVLRLRKTFKNKTQRTAVQL